ncbi:MAG: DUF6504 family protein [Propionibacteriaceae bacterium]|jgi:hypothetical protein|nr:DUF6504 family protein [Propionibacteriaceae bacterium]
MRRYDEDIEVVSGVVDDAFRPVKFRRRHRWWLVQDVLTKWVETADWWHAGGLGGGIWSGGVNQDGDLVGEEEVWRVSALPIDGGSDGVYELSHTWGSGRWRLRAVLD